MKLQCEMCSRPGTEKITELLSGKVITRAFCPRHSHAYLGGITEQEWSAFYDWIVPYFRQHGQLPTSDEIASHGKLGAAYAKNIQEGWTGVLEYLQVEIRKQLAA